VRQKELGIDTELPPVNPIGTPEIRIGPEGQPFPPLDYTRPWDTLNGDEKRLFCRMAEVYPASSPTPTTTSGVYWTTWSKPSSATTP
jgi:hypothetical protein